MDDIDRASNTQAFLDELALERLKRLHHGQRVKIDLSNPNQECFYCGGRTETEEHRWCSPECRRDWQVENE